MSFHVWYDGTTIGRIFCWTTRTTIPEMVQTSYGMIACQYRMKDFEMKCPSTRCWGKQCAVVESMGFEHIFIITVLERWLNRSECFSHFVPVEWREALTRVRNRILAKKTVKLLPLSLWWVRMCECVCVWIGQINSETDTISQGDGGSGKWRCTEWAHMKFKLVYYVVQFSFSF